MHRDARRVRSVAAWAAAGAISAMVGVMLGAFGAHALRASLEPRLVQSFETAARYQMIHALALIAVAWLADRVAHDARGAVNVAGWCFAAGTVLFSGSLYAMVLTGLRPLGAITPLGGLAFIAGWAAFAWAAWRSRT
ncbi:MAG: DUF423 domain-containing protein [Candidatus Eisenbacteria bacterium]|nr:DUF423 domain-containing protein [Candidatus Eisenbacteria bacterium]